MCVHIHQEGAEKQGELKKRGYERGWGQGKAEWYAEVVFVRATINSASSVLPPKTYRNKYAVRPARGWAAALYSNAVHMEQFITLQHRERKRVRAFLCTRYAPRARPSIAFCYCSRVELLFRNLRFVFGDDSARSFTCPSNETAIEDEASVKEQDEPSQRYIIILLVWLKKFRRDFWLKCTRIFGTW